MTTRRELIRALAHTTAARELASACGTTETVAVALLRRLPGLVRVETLPGEPAAVTLLVPFDELLLTAEATLDLGAPLPPK